MIFNYYPQKYKPVEKKRSKIEHCHLQRRNEIKEELTTSLHFLIVSRFPRLNTEFRALEEKLRDSNVSDKFETFGHTFTIITVFELPPTNIKEDLQ